MPLPDDHYDVSSELREIVRDRNFHGKFSYFYITFGFLLHAVILFGVVYLMRIFLPNFSDIVIVVISCASYAVAVLGSAIFILQQRISRMEFHALTLHNEILTNRDRICDVYDSLRHRG